MSLNIEETSISQLSNRTYASVRQYFEGQKDGHVDLSKIRAYWSEMQGEREKERKLMSKMVQVLRKSIASSDVSHRLALIHSTGVLLSKSKKLPFQLTNSSLSEVWHSLA